MFRDEFLQRSRRTIAPELALCPEVALSILDLPSVFNGRGPRVVGAELDIMLHGQRHVILVINRPLRPSPLALEQFPG